MITVHQLDPLGKFFVSEMDMRGAQSFGTAYSRQEGALTSYDPGSIRWYLSVGTPTQPRVLKRSDGASVAYVSSGTVRRWLAFAPRDGGSLRANGRYGVRRRWATPYAAMDAIDREFPCT